MVKQIYTKKDKTELYEKLLPFVSKHLKSLTTNYNYKEIAEMSGVNHIRVVEAANGHYLNENTLRLLIGGEVINLADIRGNVDLSTKDDEYLEQLAATSNPKIVRRLVRLIDKFGIDNAVKELDGILKAKR